MKKKFLFFLLSACCFSNLFSQNSNREIVSTAGEFYQTNTMLLDWTLGELSVNTVQSSNLQISQGFHQPNFTITSLNELPKELGKITVFPNPTSDWVNLDCSFDKVTNIEIELLNITGQTIWQKDVVGQQINESISLYDLPAGTYLLKILIAENYPIQSNKILKIN